MNGFRLWQETDRLCSKCRLYLAEPMDWLCQKCRQELEDKWNEVTKKMTPPQSSNLRQVQFLGNISNTLQRKRPSSPSYRKSNS